MYDPFSGSGGSDAGWGGPFAALQLLVWVEFKGPMLNDAVLTPQASWLRSFGPSLARTEIAAGRYTRLAVRVTVVHPASNGPSSMQGSEYAAFDPGIERAMVDSLHKAGWDSAPVTVQIREEWREGAEAHLEVAVYGTERPG